MELAGRPVRPKILDEETKDYQKLLDSEEVESPLFSLPCLPTPKVAPSRSGQKPGGDRNEANDVEDTRASCSGTRHDHPSPPRGQEDAQPHLSPIAPATIASISRKAAMAAFLEASYLPGSIQMRIDHITALLALLLEDPSALRRYACFTIATLRWTLPISGRYRSPTPGSL